LKSDSQQFGDSPFTFNLASRLIMFVGLEIFLDSTIDVDATNEIITRATKTKIL
jgi:hypothetical protein